VATYLATVSVLEFQGHALLEECRTILTGAVPVGRSRRFFEHLNLPKLKHLKVECPISGSTLRDIGRACPNLESLSCHFKEWKDITGEMEGKTADEIVTGLADIEENPNPCPFKEMQGEPLVQPTEV